MANPSGMATIEARWRPSTDVDRAIWHDFLRHRSRVRKWVVPGAGALLMVGVVAVAVAVMAGDRVPRIASVAIVLGTVGLGWHALDRAAWFRRVAHARPNEELVMRFEPERFEHCGPTSRGEASWDAIADVVRGDSGLILVVARGWSIYVPFTAFASPEDVRVVERYFADARQV